jgi:DNA-binding NarL/FixJ family response regulator
VREPSTIPILVIDDHQLLGTTLTLSLRTEGLRADLCRASTIDGILAEAAAMAPGLALVDLDLGRDPDGNPVDGTRLVEPLVGAGWCCLIVSGSADPARVGAALEAGAIAWVPKNASFSRLLTAVGNALSGHPVMPPARRDQLIDLHRKRSATTGELASKLARLTRREQEVLTELAAGRRAQAVADRFVVSLPTVRMHIRAVLTKLEVGSQLEAVALYRRAGR